MEKKKTYQKATMKVIGVGIATHLLAGSALGEEGNFSRANYSGTTQTWN